MHEDKRDFIQTYLAKKIPVTPVSDAPRTLITKGVLKEGGRKDPRAEARVARRTIGDFIDCLGKRIPVTSVFDMPKTLITKDVFKEGRLGILVLKSVGRSKRHPRHLLLPEDDRESVGAQFKELNDHHVYLEGAVLKPNMAKWPGGTTG